MGQCELKDLFAPKTLRYGSFWAFGPLFPREHSEMDNLDFRAFFFTPNHSEMGPFGF